MQAHVVIPFREPPDPGLPRRTDTAVVARMEANIHTPGRAFRSTSTARVSRIRLRALQERIKCAEANVGAQRGMVPLTQDRLDAEVSPELDVRQAELNLHSTASIIPTLRISVMQSTNRLGVLLGEQPGELREQLLPPQQVPDPPEMVQDAVRCHFEDEDRPRVIRLHLVKDVVLPA